MPTPHLPSTPDQPGEFLFYQTDDGQTRIQVRVEGETVWLSQKVMADLFQKDVRTISEHIRNVFDEGELQEDSVIRNFRITAADGKQYDTQHYNLDVIISVGYRVNGNPQSSFLVFETRMPRKRLNMLEIKNKKQPPAHADIEQLAPLFRGKVPAEYQEFLRQHNGCQVVLPPASHKQPWYIRFLSIREVLNAYPFLEKAYYEWGDAPEPNSFCHVPIASNDNSDYLVYVLWTSTGETYPIYQVDHDNYPFFKGQCKRFKKAESLNDLLEKLEQGVVRPF